MTTHSWDEDPSGDWVLEIENTSEANNYGACKGLQAPWPLLRPRPPTQLPGTCWPLPLVPAAPFSPPLLESAPVACLARPTVATGRLA